MLKERDVLEKTINQAIEREGKLNEQYRAVLDMMQSIASQSLKASTMEEEVVEEQEEEGKRMDSPTRRFIQSKNLEVPDPQSNRHAYMEVIDCLFKEQKFSQAGKLWGRIGYEALTQLSLERNNELLRIVIKLRDRHLAKQGRQIDNLKPRAPSIKVTTSGDNLISEEYLMRNDSMASHHPKLFGSDSGMAPEVRVKLEEYEKLKREHETVSALAQRDDPAAVQARQLERVLAAKLEECDQDLNEMLAYGPHLSSRESVLSLHDQASKRQSVLFFQLQEENA